MLVLSIKIEDKIKIIKLNNDVLFNYGSNVLSEMGKMIINNLLTTLPSKYSIYIGCENSYHNAQEQLYLYTKSIAEHLFLH